MLTKIFVYGSLMRGLHNSHLLASSELVSPHARTRHSDFFLVSGAQQECGATYPYAMRCMQARTVDTCAPLRGETYLVTEEVLAQASSPSVHAPESSGLVLLSAPQLDELEEHPEYYRREVIPLHEESDAWIYLLFDSAVLQAIRDDVNGAKFRAVNPPGDWRSYVVSSEKVES